MQSYPSTNRLFCIFALLILGTLSLSGCTAGDAPGKTAEGRTRSKEIQVTPYPSGSRRFAGTWKRSDHCFSGEVTVEFEVDGRSTGIVDVGDRVEPPAIVGVFHRRAEARIGSASGRFIASATRLGCPRTPDDDLIKVTDAAEVKKAAADPKTSG